MARTVRMRAVPVIVTLLATMALPGCLVDVSQPSATEAHTPAPRPALTPTLAIVAIPTATTQAMTPSAGGAPVPKKVSLELLGVT